MCEVSEVAPSPDFKTSAVKTVPQEFPWTTWKKMMSLGEISIFSVS